MKKTLLSLFAIATLAISFISCDNGSSSSSEVSYTTVTCTSAYAGPAWTVDDDWVSVTWEFTEAPTNIQICSASDAVEAEQSWGTSYYSAYTGEITTTTYTVTISEQLAVVNESSEDATEITTVTLQDMGDGDGVAKVIKVYATKSDDTTEELTIPEPSWGYTLTSN